MRVSDYVLKRLSLEGIDTAFCVYGGAISELMDAFTRQDRIGYVVTIHEQAAGFAAEGYAKTGGIGLAIATSGPGAGNLVTPIQDCYYDSTPCVFLTGQVGTKFINPGTGLRQLGFQETPIVDMVRPITKYARQPQNPEDVRLSLETAIYLCKSGRPGPVLLDIPIDVQKMEMTLYDEGKYSEQHIKYNDESPLFALDLLKAERPAILVGGGAFKARDSIIAYAMQHKIPCFRTWNAQDIITDDLPVYAGTVGTYGGPGRNFGIQNCDLLLSLGCRMSGRITGGMPETFARGAKKYIVDVDEENLKPVNQQVKGDVNIRGTCEDFMFFQKPVEKSFDGWLSKCRGWVEKYDPVKPEMQAWHHYRFIRDLSEAMPDNAIVISDTGGNVIMMGHCFRSKRGQRIFTSNGNTPMGFALCGAIGAWFKDPSRPIYVLIGDGGMQMNIQELQTIFHYNCDIKIFIINNHILGNTASYQRVNGMKEIACGPDGYSCPDFISVGKAYGIPSFNLSGFSPNLKFQGPVIFDVVHHNYATYEPRISRWDVGVEDSYPILPRDEFRSNMIIEPLKGWEAIQ